MSVLGQKSIVETVVWVEHNFKVTSSTVETTRERSKHTSTTVKRYLKHGRNIARAQLSAVETSLEHSRRARSIQTSSTVEKYRLFRGNSESTRKISFRYQPTFYIFDSHCKPVFQKMEKSSKIVHLYEAFNLQITEIISF